MAAHAQPPTTKMAGRNRAAAGRSASHVSPRRRDTHQPQAATAARPMVVAGRAALDASGPRTTRTVTPPFPGAATRTGAVRGDKPIASSQPLSGLVTFPAARAAAKSRSRSASGPAATRAPAKAASMRSHAAPQAAWNDSSSSWRAGSATQHAAGRRVDRPQHLAAGQILDHRRQQLDRLPGPDRRIEIACEHDHDRPRPGGVVQLHIPGISGDGPCIHVLTVDEHVEEPGPRREPEPDGGTSRDHVVAGDPAQPTAVVDRRRDQDPLDAIHAAHRRRSRRRLAFRSRHGHGLLAEVVLRPGGAGRHIGPLRSPLRPAAPHDGQRPAPGDPGPQQRDAAA